MTDTPASTSTLFRPLVLADRERVMARLRACPAQVSELTFTNLYVWRYHRPVRMAEIGGALIFADTRGGDLRVVGHPVGDVDWPALAAALREEGVAGFDRLPAAATEELSRLGLQVTEDRANADYVYRRDDLAELAGRRYHRQKNLVNRCLGAFQCEYAQVTSGTLEGVLDMLDRWFGEREMGASEGLAEEYWALRETLDHFDDFGLMGGAVLVEGRVEAFTFGEALDARTAVVHFEKAMPGVPGLYQVINQWFCRHGLAQFEFVNREQDLGVPGLRRAKESYHPHHMVEKFSAEWEPAASG